MGEGGGDPGDEQVIAIANSLAGGDTHVVEMVVSFRVHSKSVGEIGDVCDGVLGDVCDGVMMFVELQHKSVLSVGQHESVLSVGEDGYAKTSAQSRDT